MTHGATSEPASEPASGRTSLERLGLAPWLLEVLTCPQDHAPLRVDEAARELVCTGSACGLAFPVRDGIAVLLLDEARHR